MNPAAKLTDEYKAALVRVTFPIVMWDLHKRRVNSPVLAKGTPAFSNAIKFFDLSAALRRSVYDLFAQAASFYSGEWCLKTFGTPHPPFYVLTGEKCRCKLVAENPVVSGVTNNPEAAPQVLAILAGLTKQEARDLVEVGVLVGQNLKLKDEVLKKLEA